MWFFKSRNQHGKDASMLRGNLSLTTTLIAGVLAAPAAFADLGCPAGQQPTGENLIINGDFSQGLTGWTSEWLPDANPEQDVPPNNGVRPFSGTALAFGIIDQNPFGGDPDFDVDGTDTWLYSNGNDAGGSNYTGGPAIYWSQTVSGLIAGESYTFSGYYSNAIKTGSNLDDLPVLSATAGGETLFSGLEAAEDDPDNWERFEALFTAASASTVLELIDSAAGGNGDDLGTTALSLRQCTSIASPGLDLSGGSLDFGEVTLGNSADAQTVTITNSGDAALAISGITSGGTDLASYDIDSSDCGTTLAAGDSCEISVEFTPQALGGDGASITITTDAGDATVALAGTGVAVPVGSLSVTPGQIEYAQIASGSISPPQTVTVTNGGPGDLQLSAADMSSDQFEIVDGGTCAADTLLTDDQSCTIHVVFTPTSNGGQTGTLMVNTDTGSRTVNLVGFAGPEPVGLLTVTPLNAVFEDAILGEEGNILTFTFANVGGAPIDLEDASVDGPFEIVANNCEGVTSLDPNANCTIDVRFMPAEEGLNAAELSLGGTVVGMVGEGLASPVPVLSVTPVSRAFNATPVGETSDSSSIAVSNIGASTLTVSSITLGGEAGGDYVLDDSNCAGETLAANESCTISVAFQPTAEEIRRANVDVSTTAGNDQVDLYGFGTPALAGALTVSPASYVFNNTTINTDSDPVIVTVTNVGTADSALTGISLGGDDPTSYAADSTECDGTTLKAGESCDISVTFSPLAVGKLSAELTASSAEGDAVTTLTGFATAAPTGDIGFADGVLANGLAFENILLSETSEAKVITIKNNGEAPLTINAIEAADAVQFDLDSAACLAQPLAAGATCDVSVTFTPNATGNQATVVSITSNDPSEGLVNVPLTGIGSTGDRDNDGLADVIEEQGPTDPDNPDTDGDGILDGVEDANLNGIYEPNAADPAAGETDPMNRDTDGDGLEDGLEDNDHDGIRQDDETDPRLVDTDGDTLSDGDEDTNKSGSYQLGETDPLIVDTDGDEIPDNLDADNTGAPVTGVLGTTDEKEVETGLDGGVGSAGLPLLAIMGAFIGLRRRAVLGTVVLSMVSAPLMAAEDDFYIGLGAGISTLEPEPNDTGFRVTDDQDTGFKLFLGYDIRDSFSIEGYYSKLGAATLSNNTISGDIDYDMFGVNGLLYLPDSLPGWKAFLKLGVGQIETDSTNIPFTQLEDIQLTGGLGLEWMADSGFGVRADYDYFDEDAQLLTLNVLKRFGEPKAVPKDSDQDGVMDASDQCLGTPVGTQVDVVGCPFEVKPQDTDGDGVLDAADKCPGTAKGIKVNSTGCPLDGDKDGVIDAVDKCPNTPAGYQVDSTGCPLDSDGDGVADAIDQCPATPAGTRVDVNGCKVEEIERFTGVLQGVNFYTASAELRPEARVKLDRLSEQLLQYPDARIIVVGHTDNRGSAEDNQELSNNRARSVANYLVSRGLVAAQMRYTGKGEAEPVASNDTKVGRAENRRVELVVR